MLTVLLATTNADAIMIDSREGQIFWLVVFALKIPRNLLQISVSKCKNRFAKQIWVSTDAELIYNGQWSFKAFSIQGRGPSSRVYGFLKTSQI